MPNMPPGGENKSSEKGMAHAKKSSGSGKVAGIEEHHAGEKGSQGGGVFKIPEYIDHSCVRTPEHK